jgi:tetratricopeptide (TPR) repeat protein
MMTTIKKSEALFAQGKIEEANEILSQIIERNPKSKDALNNLGVIAFQRGDVEEAIEYFTRTLEIDPFHRDAILNFSDLLKSVNRFGESIPILENGVAKFPRDEEMNRLLNEARQTLGFKPKIAVMCLRGLESFLGDIIDFLKTRADVRTCYSTNGQEIESAIHWADIVWLEWANEMAIHITNKIPQIKDKKVICRLHGYEVFSEMPAQINWSAIDHLVFVAKHKQEIFNRRFKIQSPTQTIIRNGINIDKFTVSNNKRNTKRLVIIGHLNFRKGIPLLLQFYHELLKADPDYYLYIRGEFQDLRLEMAVRTMIRELSLDRKLEFVNWVEDLNSWLADKSHILSFSLEE